MSQLGESIDGRKRKQLRKLRLLMGAFEVGTMKYKISMEEVAAMAVGQAMEEASMEAANMEAGAGEVGDGEAGDGEVEAGEAGLMALVTTSTIRGINTDTTNTSRLPQIGLKFGKNRLQQRLQEKRRLKRLLDGLRDELQG